MLRDAGSINEERFGAFAMIQSFPTPGRSEPMGWWRANRLAFSAAKDLFYVAYRTLRSPARWDLATKINVETTLVINEPDEDRSEMANV